MNKRLVSNPEPMTGEYVIFQASKEMVNLYNKSIFSAANASLKEYELECSDEQYKTLWAFVIANLGSTVFENIQELF